MRRVDLIKKYPWLQFTNTVEEYLPPEYYRRLLRPYIFSGITDLELLKDFLKNKKISSILELGCGSGRASSVVAQLIPNATYTFSDLSERMLGEAKKHLPNHASFVVSDAIKFIENTSEQYDLLYSLWSFSHSIHQHFHYLGIKKAKQYISLVIKKFIKENLITGGLFFLIHFDSLSDEQRILMRQWKRIFPVFANIERQSPSKEIIDQVLLDLDNNGVITISLNHLRGDPITYDSENDVLETFMNFHLETYFNRLSIRTEVIKDISSQIKKYRNPDGSYSITPGCYVYSFIKN